MQNPSRAAPGGDRPSALPPIPRLLLAPVPLALLQPLLTRIANHVAQKHPHMFDRLGEHTGKRFIIDADELPFVMLLVPQPGAVRMEALRRDPMPRFDAHVAGTFFDLFDMIDGQVDGDSLFFNRRLRITGDVEAVVRLRNALDDLDESVSDTSVEALGPLSGPAKVGLNLLRKLRGGSSVHERI